MHHLPSIYLKTLRRKCPVFRYAVCIAGSPAEQTSTVKNKLRKVAARSRALLHWVPSYCGVPCNKKTDKLANKGRQCEQQSKEVTFFEQRRAIHAARRGQNKLRDDYHTFDKQGLTIILRLRTGHNRLNKHIYRFCLSATPQCTSCLSEQTVQHVLQECPLSDHLRGMYWPDGSTQHSKLYGAREMLQKTIEFIKETYFTI
jgi:hypothetical protein